MNFWPSCLYFLNVGTTECTTIPDEVLRIEPTGSYKYHINGPVSPVPNLLYLRHYHTCLIHGVALAERPKSSSYLSFEKFTEKFWVLLGINMPVLLILGRLRQENF